MGNGNPKRKNFKPHSIVAKFKTSQHSNKITNVKEIHADKELRDKNGIC
jgi:hypothetical protein